MSSKKNEYATAEGRKVRDRWDIAGSNQTKPQKEREEEKNRDRMKKGGGGGQGKKSARDRGFRISEKRPQGGGVDSEARKNRGRVISDDNHRFVSTSTGVVDGWGRKVGRRRGMRKPKQGIGRKLYFSSERHWVKDILGKKMSENRARRRGHAKGRNRGDEAQAELWGRAERGSLGDWGDDKIFFET